MSDQHKRIDDIMSSRHTPSTAGPGLVKPDEPTPKPEPEQVASSEPKQEAYIPPPVDPEKNQVVVGGKRRKFWIRLPRKKLTWAIIAVLVLAIAGTSYWYFALRSKPHKPVAAVVIPAKQPTTVASSLTGLQVSPATNQLPITAIMIENSTDARPQSGLSNAGVVFEAMAEGGITRFLAVYQSNDNFSVGPIRSARPYYISWELGFDAAYAHVGGSQEALSDIGTLGVRDLPDSTTYFQRITSRPSPHNDYSTLADLYKYEQSKGYVSSKFTSWLRKPGKPLAQPTAATISMEPSQVSDYSVGYTYDPQTNSYNRSNGGAAAVDADTNKQLSPNVVIAMVTQESNGPLDGLDAYYSEYTTVGSGTAYIFQDGGVTVGQWSKTSNASEIAFTDSTGKSIALDPGQVWITAITASSYVTYSK